MVGVTEEVHLIRFVDAEREDDHIALAALEPLNRIDHHLLHAVYAGLNQPVPDQRNLVAVGSDDADGAAVERLPVRCVEGPYRLNQPDDGVGLRPVDLVGEGGAADPLGGEEEGAFSRHVAMEEVF